jgi:hypothetical protein
VERVEGVKVRVHMMATKQKRPPKKRPPGVCGVRSPYPVVVSAATLHHMAVPTDVNLVCASCVPSGFSR